MMYNPISHICLSISRISSAPYIPHSCNVCQIELVVAEVIKSEFVYIINFHKMENGGGVGIDFKLFTCSFMVFSEILVCCKCVLISMPTQFWPERCRRQGWGLKYNTDVFYKKKSYNGG